MQRDATADRTMELVDALYAFAEEPDRWLDAIEAIERLPAALNGDAARLAAHAERAAALAERLNEARRRDAATPWDAVLLSAEGQVRAIIGDAERRLAAFLKRPLAMFERPAFGGALCEGFACAFETANKRRHGGLAHWTLTSAETNERCFAILMARTAFPRDLAAAFGLSEIAPEPLFALAILNDDAPAGERTRESLGLTRAEWRLADQVKKGISVADAAAESGISVNTARTQLKSAFAKLGVARQSELVSRLNLAGRIDAAPQAEPDLPAHAPPRRFVLLDDGRCLAYREYGDPFGKPVIHFHQWFTASILPLAAIKAVRKSGLRFLVFDRPGFGQSAPLAAHSFEAVARDVAAFADKLKLSRFAVMGTAPGGAFAVAAALAMPERVTKLALIAPRLSSIPAALAHGAAQRSLIGVLRHPWIIRPIVATLRAGMSDRLAASLLRHACADADSDRKIVDDPAAVRWIKSMAFDAHETSIAGMVAELELYAGSEFPHPGRLRCPIAAWHGAGDTVIPLDAAREVLDPMPNAAVHVLPGVAVLFPEAAYRTIFEWLEE